MHMTYHNTMLSDLYLLRSILCQLWSPNHSFWGPLSERLELFVCCVVSVSEGLLGNSLLRTPQWKMLEVLLVILIIYWLDDYCFQVCIETSVWELQVWIYFVSCVHDWPYYFCFLYAKASDYLFWVLRLILTNLFSDFVTVGIRQQLLWSNSSKAFICEISFE